MGRALCVKCHRHRRHGRWYSCYVCMLPIWKAAAAKAWRTRRRQWGLALGVDRR